MTVAAIGAAPEAEETVQDAHGGAPGGKPTVLVDNSPDDVKAEAMTMGWHPPEDFDPGRGGKFVTAEEFVARGEAILPILRKNYRENKAELREVKDLLAEQIRMQKAQTDRAVKQAVEKLQRERSEAILEADVRRVGEIDQQIAEVQAAPAPAPAPEPPKAQKISQEVVDWVEQNEWFKKSPRMAKLAEGVYVEELADGKSETEALKAAAAEVRKHFPEKFPQSRRSEPPSVEGGSGARPRKVSKTWADLPADAQALCDRMVKAKVVTREAYLKNYVW